MLKNQKKTTKKAEEIETYNVTVLKVREIPNRPGCYRFNANVNGIILNGLQYIAYVGDKGEDRSFISMTAYKGSDDKYYNHYYFRISDELLKEIEKQLSTFIEE